MEGFKLFIREFCHRGVTSRNRMQNILQKQHLPHFVLQITPE